MNIRLALSTIAVATACLFASCGGGSTPPDSASAAAEPVYFFYGQRDPYFGALTPNPDGRCASGSPGSVSGKTYCLAAGQLQYPYVARFVATWQAAAVRGVEFDAASEHVTQETAPQRIVQIVDGLNTN